jgi:hypothetical protein
MGRMKMYKLFAMVSLLCITGEAFSQTRDKCPSVIYEPQMESAVFHLPQPEVIDTVRTVLLVYTKIPGIIFTKMGYCVRKNGWCIRAHLDSRQRPVKLPIHVLSCKVDEVERGE